MLYYVVHVHSPIDIINFDFKASNENMQTLVLYEIIMFCQSCMCMQLQVANKSAEMLKEQCKSENGCYIRGLLLEDDVQ